MNSASSCIHPQTLTDTSTSFKLSLTIALTSALAAIADTCDLRGWHSVEMVVGAGGANAPISYTFQGFVLNYEGGVPIGSSKNDLALNPISMEGATISPGALGQPNEIQWSSGWDVATFTHCGATYNGVTADGTVNDCGDGTLGTTCSECVVKFECESRLAKRSLFGRRY